MNNTTTTGNMAEDSVARELADQGYKIVGRNWKTKFAEIDIIAERDKALYFVEVKYRRTANTGDGFDYITSQKLHRMRRAAEAYVLNKNWQDEYTLMAASVVGALDNLQIEIIEI